MGLTFDENFPGETWTLYGFGILVILIRMWVWWIPREHLCSRGTRVDVELHSASRIHKLGITKIQADDYLMANALFWYTLLAVSINKIIASGGSNFMTAEEEANLTPTSIKDRIEGSKWVFISEQAMIITIWSLKLCMLFIYGRLTYVISSCHTRRCTFNCISRVVLHRSFVASLRYNPLSYI